MFFGYLFDKNDYHTPKQSLLTARNVFEYCITHCKTWPRIIITDTDDYCVLEVNNQQLKVPLPDNTFEYLDLSKHSVDELFHLLNITPINEDNFNV